MRFYEVLCQTTYRVEETLWHQRCPYGGVIVTVEDEDAFLAAIKDPRFQEVRGEVRHEETRETLFRLVGVRRGLSGRCLALICEDLRTTNSIVLYTDVSVAGAHRQDILRAAASEMSLYKVTKTEKYWDRVARSRCH